MKAHFNGSHLYRNVICEPEYTVYLFHFMQLGRFSVALLSNHTRIYSEDQNRLAQMVLGPLFWSTYKCDHCVLTCLTKPHSGRKTQQGMSQAYAAHVKVAC